MMEIVVRPLWREFPADKLRAAAQHAKAGGVAVVKDKRWKLLGDAGPPGEDLGVATTVLKEGYSVLDRAWCLVAESSGIDGGLLG